MPDAPVRSRGRGRGRGPAGARHGWPEMAPGRRWSQAGRRQARDDRRPARTGQGVLAAATTAAGRRRRLAGALAVAAVGSPCGPLKAAWRDLAAVYPSTGGVTAPAPGRAAAGAMPVMAGCLGVGAAALVGGPPGQGVVDGRVQPQRDALALTHRVAVPASLVQGAGIDGPGRRGSARPAGPATAKAATQSGITVSAAAPCMWAASTARGTPQPARRCPPPASAGGQVPGRALGDLLPGRVAGLGGENPEFVRDDLRR
jgi:hypothetical protein